MKRLLVVCMLAAAPFAIAQTKAPGPAMPMPTQGTSVSGEVLEVKNVEGYTYLRLKTAQGETWAAVPTAAVKTGTKVTVVNAMVMSNFESKALKKTFDKVVFGTLGTAAAAGTQQAAAPQAPAAKAPEAPDVKVPKATGPNARTVAEVVAKPAELKDKPVLIRAKVVKYNGGIMGKNWLHVRDGSGSAADNTNDIIVTTSQEAKVGEIVTVKGVVRTDKNLGSGYSYKVLVEDATLQR